MKARCYCVSNSNYAWYGGRGIRICREWLDDPTKFYAWAKASGRRPGLQIDRIDNDGDYSPRNCRWVTPAENIRNSRRLKPRPANACLLSSRGAKGALRNR